MTSTVKPLRAASSVAGALPEYAVELAAFHRAFQPELQALVDAIPLVPHDRVVDVGCGDGFYCGLIAERLRLPGGVIGVDGNSAYLNLAVNRLADVSHCSIDLLQGDVEQLPHIVREPADAVWCAQSLFSFPEPEAALRRMAAVVRPGGLVAVLENDTLHQLLVPWPAEIETALRGAELEALHDQSREPDKYYVGRRLPAVLAAAGIEPLGFQTQAIDRAAPVEPVLELFLKSYFERIVARVEPLLDRPTLNELKELVRPEGDRYLLRQPFFTLTWLNVLAWGRVPATAV